MAVLAFLPNQPTYSEPEIIVPVVQAPAAPTVSVNEIHVKNTENIHHLEKCNCYLYVKHRVLELPFMGDITPNVEPKVGAVAIEYFGKVKHVSIVTEVTDTGVMVEEANYTHCKTGTRFIEFSHYSLVGFWSAG